MKLLITGGAGFIGSNFIDHWFSRYPKDTIFNLDSMTYAANPLTIKRHLEEYGTRYKHILGSINDRDLVDEYVKRVDTIIHFAAESHVDRSLKEPGKFVMTNVLGTQVLLSSALETGNKRFHHISTDEVFGTLELNSSEKFSENSPYDPRSPYSASKAGSDHLVNAYFETYGLPITITNCSNNYGPYQFPEKVIPLYILRLLAGEQIPVYGKGTAIRDYLFVKDHCTAIETVVLKGKIGETYCVGGDSERSTMDVANSILELIGASNELIIHTPDRPGHDPRYSIDHSKITKELGWKPDYSFEEGLRMAVEWYKTNKDWWEPIWPKAQEVAERYLNSK